MLNFHTPFHRISILFAIVFLNLVALLTVLSPKNAEAMPSFAGTVINSDIVTNTTWINAGSPYIISVPITVTNNITLTVEPGVTIVLSNDLEIDGSLIAWGTVSQAITFSSTITKVNDLHS